MTVSLWPSASLGQGQEEPDRFLYWEAIPGLLGGDVQPRSVAVRRGKWKAIQPRADRPVELYDLEADIGEQHTRGGAASGGDGRDQEVSGNGQDDSPDLPAPGAELAVSQAERRDTFSRVPSSGVARWQNWKRAAGSL